MMFIINETG